VSRDFELGRVDRQSHTWLILYCIVFVSFPVSVTIGFRHIIMNRILLLGGIACTQCIICGLLLQMSHVAWSVCLSISP